MNSRYLPDSELDCRGMNCPLPILHTRIALNRLEVNSVLKVYADDPDFRRDIERFCFQADIELLDVNEKDSHSEFFLMCRK